MTDVDHVLCSAFGRPRAPPADSNNRGGRQTNWPLVSIINKQGKEELTHHRCLEPLRRLLSAANAPRLKKEWSERMHSRARASVSRKATEDRRKPELVLLSFPPENPFLETNPFVRNLRPEFRLNARFLRLKTKKRRSAFRFPHAHGRPLRRPPRRRRIADAAPPSSCSSPVGEGVPRGREHAPSASAGRQRRDAQHAPAGGHPPRPQAGDGESSNSGSGGSIGRGRRVEERDPPRARRHRQQFPGAACGPSSSSAAAAAAALEEARAHRRRRRRGAAGSAAASLAVVENAGPAPANPHRPRVDNGDAARPRSRDGYPLPVAGPAAGGRRRRGVRPGRGKGEERRRGGGSGGGSGGTGAASGLPQGPEAQAAVGARGGDERAAAAAAGGGACFSGGERGAEDVGGSPARGQRRRWIRPVVAARRRLRLRRREASSSSCRSAASHSPARHQVPQEDPARGGRDAAPRVGRDLAGVDLLRMVGQDRGLAEAGESC